MANKTLRYELVGINVAGEPTVTTGSATLRLFVRTKRGAPVTLLVTTDVYTTLHARDVLKGLCAVFRNRVAALYERLA